MSCVAQVVVVAGPSGAGKSALCRRLALPTVNLDHFYKDGSDPSLPRTEIRPGHQIVDWDDPASWARNEAIAALERLCTTGVADLPVYDIAHDARVGRIQLDLAGASYFLAEGIFAHEVVADCRALDCLADAVCVRNNPMVTFWRRLSRDLREHRKPPLVLVRRGLHLLRAEPGIVARAVEAGCVPLTPHEAYERVAARVAPG
jgi:uridine kinase